MNGKFLPVFALAMLGTDPDPAQTAGPGIEGIVVNGTQDGKTLTGAEVILRAGADGSLQPVAQTVTDRDGRFVFDKLPAEPGLIFLPGANRHGVHYPGQRLRLPATNPVKLVVFDAVTSPNPLIADSHEIDIQIQTGVLEITETLVVNNPSLTTYVGQGVSEASPTTLALSIPDGFERVTFHKEFNGRRFKLVDKRLVTDLPWTPGKREVKFTYHLPVEESKRFLEWSADLPCALVRLRVHGENADQFECNLPCVATPDKSTIVFESSEQTVPAGHITKLQLGALPTPWIGYLRWSALGGLGSLILVTVGFRIIRRARSKPVPQGASSRSPYVHQCPAPRKTGKKTA